MNSSLLPDSPDEKTAISEELVLVAYKHLCGAGVISISPPEVASGADLQNAYGLMILPENDNVK